MSKLMEDVKIGDVRTYEMDVTADTISMYMAASGDENPIHWSQEYASSTRFGRPIAHGGIIFDFISKVLGNAFPGAGTVYMEQSLQFRMPVYPGQRIVLTVRVVDTLPDMGAVLETDVAGPDGLVARGKATVKLPGWATIGVQR